MGRPSGVTPVSGMEPRIEAERVEQRNNFLLLFVFCAGALLWILQALSHLTVDEWMQYLGFVGALLLGTEALGRRHTGSIDRFLERNKDRIILILNDLYLYLTLVRLDDARSRSAANKWYVFAVLDIALVVIWSGYAFPRIGTSTYEVLEQLPAVVWYLIPGMLFVPMFLGEIAIKPHHDYKFLHRTRRAASAMVSAPGLLLIGLLVLPWMLLVTATWALLRIIVGVIQLRIRLRLGSALSVLGFVFLLVSFILFASEHGVSGG